MKTITTRDRARAQGGARIPDADALREVGLAVPPPAGHRHAYAVALHGEEKSRHLTLESALARAAQVLDEHEKTCRCGGVSITHHVTGEEPRIVCDGMRWVS